MTIIEPVHVLQQAPSPGQRSWSQNLLMLKLILPHILVALLFQVPAKNEIVLHDKSFNTRRPTLSVLAALV